MDWFLRLDTSLFFLFNVKLANPQFDVIMPFLTNLDNWRIVIVLLLIGFATLGGKQGRLFTLLLIITIALTDQTSSHVIKPIVARIRPCNELEGVRLLVDCSGAYSFPSSHATNMFGAATLFTFFYRPLWPFFFLVAVLVSYSRIYVGVHYPFDVAGGAALGVTCAGLVIALRLYVPRLFSRNKK